MSGNVYVVTSYDSTTRTNTVIYAGYYRVCAIQAGQKHLKENRGTPSELQTWESGKKVASESIDLANTPSETPVS